MTVTFFHVLEADSEKKIRKKKSKACILVKLLKVAAFISDQKKSS